MKISYLAINGYKNLIDFKVYFPEEASEIALIGKNGSGKSNVLEAITEIFLAIDSDKYIPQFDFVIHYQIYGEKIEAKYTAGTLKIKKEGKTLPKKNYRHALPTTIFLYYAGETKRLENLALSLIDRKFTSAMKKGEIPNYKRLTFLTANDLGLSLLANQCYKTKYLEKIKNLLKIEEVLPSCNIHLKRPNWGRRGDPETFWSAKGYILEQLEILSSVGTYKISNSGQAVIEIEDCETLKTNLGEPENLFKSLKILMEADILERVEIEVMKDGAIFDCSELSEGEKQLANLLSIVNFTKEYSSLFLLDEFDSYLHPLWQRDFAELIHDIDISGEIIFTTHSPLTLSKMKNAIFVLERGKVAELSIETYNRSAEEVMEEAMEINLRPTEHQEMIKEFSKAIAQKNPENAKKIEKNLQNSLSASDPFFITSSLSIARIERK